MEFVTLGLFAVFITMSSGFYVAEEATLHRINERTSSYPVTTQRECAEYFSSNKHSNEFKEEDHCQPIFDMLLCWPPTPVGQTAYLPCPPFVGLDPSKFARRTCSDDGYWQGRQGLAVRNPRGWTDYTSCYGPQVLRFLKKQNMLAVQPDNN